LGPEKLQAMIRRIFDGLADEQYCLVQVAEQYGLSKATLSRFAGIRWGSGSDPLASPVPDLWRNTAKVIGNDPDLVEAARHAGVWQQIELVTQDQPAPASPGKVNS
jgi:hypothetical protein